MDSNIHPVDYLFNWIAAAPFSDVSEDQNMACGLEGATTQPQGDIIFTMQPLHLLLLNRSMK